MPALVSVLVPAYNARTLDRGYLKSAIGQTWPTVEVIVVDDGSTDATLDTAQACAGSRVNVITQPNAGASAARNKALSIAQGDSFNGSTRMTFWHRTR